MSIRPFHRVLDMRMNNRNKQAWEHQNYASHHCNLLLVLVGLDCTPEVKDPVVYPSEKEQVIESQQIEYNCRKEENDHEEGREYEEVNECVEENELEVENECVEENELEVESEYEKSRNDPVDLENEGVIDSESSSVSPLEEDFEKEIG